MQYVWPSKDPIERFAVQFDFSAVLASITSCSIDLTVSAGVDPSPSVLDGDAQISGKTVVQRVKSGLHKCSYKLKCTATDGIETYVLAQTLPVRTR